MRPMTATARATRLLLVGLLVAGCQTAAVEPSDATGTPQPVADAATVTPTPTPTPTLRPTPAPTARPTPAPTPLPTPTLPPKEAFAFNLYQEGDWVQQHTFEWCVGASIQMAWNLTQPENRGSYEDQQALWELARDLSARSPFRGANPPGWAAALNEIGLGPYELVSVPDYDEALRTAAAAMRETNRSVGLVMWRGRHAWVMNGFESVGDPAVHADFSVTGIRVVDPLYPYGSGTWGPSPEPNSLLSPEQLATQFVVREPRRWSEPLGAGYILVLPVSETAES